MVIPYALEMVGAVILMFFLFVAFPFIFYIADFAAFRISSISLTVSLRVTVLSCDWDPNRVNLHMCSLFSFDWDPNRLSPSAILVVV